MPVTTKTFYNMTLLNRIFAVTAVLLVIATIMAVLDDWHTEYRKPQLDTRVWETAFSNAGLELVKESARRVDLNKKLDELSQVTRELKSNPEYEALNNQLAEIKAERDKLAKNLGLFVTGNIAPVTQLVEKFEIKVKSGTATESDKDQLAAYRHELADYVEKKRVGENELKMMEINIEDHKASILELEKPIEAKRSEIADIQKALDKASKLQSEYDPGLLGTMGEIARNMPLLDWANPSIKPKQQLVSDVYTDVNLAQVQTLDRCMSCHTNIDNPQFSEEAVIRFLERQVANDQGQAVIDMGSVQPVVMLDYKERQIQLLNSNKHILDNAPASSLEEAQKMTIKSYNSIIRKADSAHPIRSQLAAHITTEGSTYPKLEDVEDLKYLIALVQVARPDDWEIWYKPLTIYNEILDDILDRELDKKQRRALRDMYRYSLITAYNRDPSHHGRTRLNAGRHLLAHPDLDLYAHPDSKHPIVSMGCTSCHGGSGEETQFVHTAHTPSDLWVDAESGMFIADFLITQTGSDTEINSLIRDSRRVENSEKSNGESQNHNSVAVIPSSGVTIQKLAYSPPTTTPTTPTNAPTNAHTNAHTESNGVNGNNSGSSNNNNNNNDIHINNEHGLEGDLTTIHADHWYSDENIIKDPLGPLAHSHAEAGVYADMDTGQYKRAIKQKRKWEDSFGWHEIPYHYWEFPMHELRFVESSCTRCHESIVDIEKQAPVLNKGRLLFTEIGCVNCHPTDQLGSPLRDKPGLPDVVQVGPNLTHVKHKLDKDMISSWVMAPKAFRPNTRMPHIWLTENGSSPLDIRRTRTEVSSIAYYLSNAPDDPDKPAYNPEPVPGGSGKNMPKGDINNGRKLFKTIGCTACHANVNEYGLEWVTLDIMERYGLDLDGARNKIAQDAKNVSSLENPESVAQTNVGFFELDNNGDPTEAIRPDQYTRLQWYLMAYERDRFTRFGPDLSAVGTKLLYNRTREQATSWIYDWLRNPTHYSFYTRMPNLRLEPGEALDLAAYLLSQKHPTYEPQKFVPDELMLNALLINLQAAKISDKLARDSVSKMTLDEKRFDLGKRMIQHHGCFGCHQVPGFSSDSAVSAPLTTWGRRDPHKLDFGYFDHVYDASRPAFAEVWTTYREGTFEGAVKITEDSIGKTGIIKKKIPWESVHVDRRGYLESKLHNSRIFDRNRLGREGAITEDGKILYTDKATRTKRLIEENGKYISADNGSDSDLNQDQIEILDVGKPYEKLRMPRFFMSASDAEAIVTFVTSLQPPLVNKKLQQVTDKMGDMRIKGRLQAHVFNCMACHNINMNEPLIQQYYQVRNKDGSLNYGETVTNLDNAPPRLIGNGAKTRFDWFYNFINNVEMIRPWLEVRMPSFNINPEQSQTLVDYLAGQTTQHSKMIADILDKVDEELSLCYNKNYSMEFEKAMKSGNNESQADIVAKTKASEATGQILLLERMQDVRTRLGDLAAKLKLYPPNQLPNNEMDEDELAVMYGQIYYDLAYLRDTYREVGYPFQVPPVPAYMSDLDLRRGERLIAEETKCFECHTFGDYKKLEQIFDIKQAIAAASLVGVFNDQPAAATEEDDSGYYDQPTAVEEEDYYDEPATTEEEDDGNYDQPATAVDDGYSDQPVASGDYDDDDDDDDDMYGDDDTDYDSDEYDDDVDDDVDDDLDYDYEDDEDLDEDLDEDSVDIDEDDEDIYDDYGDEDDEDIDDYELEDSAAVQPVQPVAKKLTLYDKISAPNLGNVPNRIQTNYIRRWLRKPALIRPGTRMPSHWGADGLVSHFATRLPEDTVIKNAVYGATATEQIELIINWLYYRADQGYTVGEYLLDIENIVKETTDDPEEQEVLRQRLRQLHDQKIKALDDQMDSEARKKLGLPEEDASTAEDNQVSVNSDGVIKNDNDKSG